jgi:hypothetical protein
VAFAAVVKFMGVKVTAPSVRSCENMVWPYIHSPGGDLFPSQMSSDCGCYGYPLPLNFGSGMVSRTWRKGPTARIRAGVQIISRTLERFPSLLYIYRKKIDDQEKEECEQSGHPG